MTPPECVHHNRRWHGPRAYATAVLAALLLAASCSKGVPVADNEAGSSGAPVPVVEEEPPAADLLVTPAPAKGTAGVWTALREPGVGGRVTSLFIDPNDPDHLVAGGDMLGLATSRDGGSTWKPASGLRSLEIGQITADPAGTVLWAGTMSGPYRSDDGGDTWEERRVGFPPLNTADYSAPVEIVLHDPKVAGRLLAFGGSHREWETLTDPLWGVVWESTDDGDSWTQLSEIASGKNVVDAVFLADGSTLLANALDTGVFASTDGGATWDQIDTNLPHQDVRGLAAHPDDPSVVWVALGNGTDPSSPDAGAVLRSDDAGRTWTTGSGLNDKVDPDPNLTSTYWTVKVAPSNPDVVYTADVSWGENSLYRSDDGGRNWNQVLTKNNRPTMAYRSAATAEALVINAESADDVLIGTPESVLRSQDAGATWIDLTSSPTTDGGFVGRGWSGLVATDVLFNPVRPNEAMLLSFDGGNPLVSTDNLTTWRRPVIGHDAWGGAYAASVAGADGNRVYVLLGQAGIFNGIVRSDDAGATWTTSHGTQSGLPDRYEWLGEDYSIHAFADEPGRVIATIAGNLYRSLDGGNIWEVIDEGHGLTDIGTDPADPSRIYIGGADGVYESDDRGESLQEIAGPLAAVRVTYHAASQSVYATEWRTETGGLFRYRDDAWEKIHDDPYSFEVAVDPRDANHLLLVGNDHPFHDEILSTAVRRSVDGGVTWTDFDDGLQIGRVAAVAFDPHTPGRAVIGSFGQGFFLMDGLTTG